MSDLGLRLVQAAVFGPAVAAVLWLGLAPWRWPRRVVAGVVALVSHAAAWWVFWLAYLGRGPAWRGLSPSLLAATIVAVAEVGILLAAVRSERRPAAAPAAVAGLGASTVALVVAGYTDSLILLAIAIPLPTLAVLASSFLEGSGRWGLFGLAAADVLAVLGLSVVYDRTDTAALAASTGLGVALLLVGAAVKAGAVAEVGTSRLSSSDAPSSSLAAVLRGQGVLLAAIAAVVLAEGQQMAAAANTAAVLALLAGSWALLARPPGTIAASASAAGASVLFLALGLGGGFGVRAFLVLFPAFLLGAAVLQLVGSDREGAAAERTRHRVARAAGVLALGVALGSLLGLPPGSGFPGTWMAVSLAVVRGGSMPLYLLLAAGVLVGLALAGIGGIRLLRMVRPTITTAALAVPAALLLLYAGAQPVRLGIGWWLRVEEALPLPTVVPSAGGPTLPVVGGRNLVLVLAPGLLLALVAVALGRGMRVGLAPEPVPEGAGRRPFARVAAYGTRIAGPLLRRPVIGLVVILVLEAAAVALAVRLLVLGAMTGFL